MDDLHPALRPVQSRQHCSKLSTDAVEHFELLNASILCFQIQSVESSGPTKFQKKQEQRTSSRGRGRGQPGNLLHATVFPSSLIARPSPSSVNRQRHISCRGWAYEAPNDYSSCLSYVREECIRISIFVDECTARATSIHQLKCRSCLP